MRDFEDLTCTVTCDSHANRYNSRHSQQIRSFYDTCIPECATDEVCLCIVYVVVDDDEVVDDDSDGV